MESNKIVDEIIITEWEQFTAVRNIGTRSYCQDRKVNFLISRKVYWNIYNDDIKISYLEDLKKAEKKGIFLVTQKYAYMMKDTSPEYFEIIKSKLIDISKSKEEIVNLIMYICEAWLKEIEINLEDKGHRPLYKSGDSLKTTSVETYLRGEYMSYSDKTLVKILIYFIEKMFDKDNLLLRNLRELSNYSSF